jgi:hypothetical protein
MRDKQVPIRGLAEGDPKARELVKAVQSVLASDQLNLETLKRSLITLLEYLSYREGRINANCRAVDSFFMADDRWVERNLPDPFHDIFTDIAGALHDMVLLQWGRAMVSIGYRVE